MYKLYKTTFGENAVSKINEDGSMSSFILGANNPEEQAYLAWLALPCGTCEGRGAIPDFNAKNVIPCPSCNGMQRNTPLPAENT